MQGGGGLFVIGLLVGSGIPGGTHVYPFGYQKHGNVFFDPGCMSAVPGCRTAAHHTETAGVDRNPESARLT